MSTHYISKAFLYSCCLLTTSAFAMEFIPETPGISLSGYVGSESTLSGDIMAPLFGQPLNFTYINPQINYTFSNQYTGSLGTGQRWMTKNHIWGGYVFGDYRYNGHNQNFWFISPGVEELGRTWDFSLNAYLPPGHQRVDTGTAFADQTGDFSQITFSGHNQYDALVNTFATTGWGFDSQVSLHLAPLHHLKLTAGGYYFTPQDSNAIIGGIISEAMPLNEFLTASVSQGYDNADHLTIRAGLSLSLGSRHSGCEFVDDLSERLVEPVQRQIITLAGAQAGEPIAMTTVNTGQTALEMSHISFFIPSDTANASTVSGNGTYENPYQGFSQNNVNDANQQNNRNFYLNTGQYNVIYSSDSTAIFLNNDQLYGRENNFLQAAQGTKRPVLNFSQGGLALSSDNANDSINDLQLSGAGVGTGISVSHNNDDPSLLLNINDVTITHFNTGVSLSNNANTTVTAIIDHSDLNNNIDSAVQAQNSGSGGLNLTLNHSQLENNGGSGIYLVDYHDGNLTATIKNTTISDNANNGIYAIDEFNNGVLTLNLKNDLIADNTYNGVQVYNGTPTFNTNTGNTVINIDRSTISGNGQTGVNVSNTSTGVMQLKVTRSNITGNTLNGISAINIEDSGSLSVWLRNSTITGNQLNGLEIFNENNSGNLQLNIAGSRITNNHGNGIFMDNSNSNGDFNAKISNSRISENNMNGIHALNDLGNGSLTLIISDSSIHSNTQEGLFLDNHGKTGYLHADIMGSQILGNGLTGVTAFNESNTGNLILHIDHTIIGNNGLNGVSLNTTSTAASLTADITDSLIVNNKINGLFANNHVTADVTNSTITGNAHDITTKNGAVVILTDSGSPREKP